MGQRFVMTVSYDGTNYCGWQRQNQQPTVAGVLEQTFFKTFGQEITVIGVSRTDAGVHARGQVATFVTEVSLDVHKIKFAWNNQLPATVLILSLAPVSYSYNPFLHVEKKIYLYTIFLQRPLPFVCRYGWYVHMPLAQKDLQEALSLFVGTHDFRSFSTGDERGEDTVRTIDSIVVEQVAEGTELRVIVTGQKFLRHMIRRIIGAAVDVVVKQISLDVLKKALLEKNAHQQFFNAPPQGLVLYSIEYKQ